MAYSREQLLLRLREGSATLGWGAVAAYSRSRLNRLLEQQYHERLDTLSFLPPYKAELTSDGPRAAAIELEGLTFGTPRLSFINASVSNSRARLSMNLVAGRCTTVQLSDGALINTFTLTEAMGYTLEMDLDLALVTGEVDRHGRVTLDLAEGASMRCNLLAEQLDLNRQLVAGLEAWFHDLPARMSQFDLGIIDFQGYHPLTPQRFIIRTQAAPGAKLSQAKNQGDGAVLVFIRVYANQADGASPDASYPYLIPDGDYSATLLLDRSLIQYAGDRQLEILNSLLFPGTYAFVETERHTPHDLLVLGNIDPLRSTYAVAPAGAVIQAGEQQAFTLLDGQGNPVRASRWRAVSLASHLSEGHGSINGQGVYTAARPEQIGHESLTVVITAELDGDKPGEVYVASTRLQVRFESLAIYPGTASFWPGQQQAIPLAGWKKDAQGVQWSLLGPVQGELSEQDDHRVVFVPDQRLATRPLVAQQVEARNGEARNAALVMVNGQQLLGIHPAHVPNLKHGQSTELVEPVAFMPGAERRWRVLSGGGEVDQAGAFSISGQGSGASVVVCEVVRNGVVFASGYSLVQHSDLAQEGTWKELNVFTIKVLSGQDGNRQGSQFNNGFQQLELEVFIETAKVGEKEYPLSVTELATLALYHERTPERVETLPPEREGIEFGAPELWAVSARPNRFNLANGTTAGQRRTASNRESRILLYLHSRAGAGQTRQFYAGFQSDAKAMHWSNDTTDHNSRIEVVARGLTIAEGDYTFERKRVDGGGGDGGNEEDDFDFHLTTIDYWTFRYRHSNFVACEVLGMEGNKIVPGKWPNVSMATWEGSRQRDRMFSYSGLIFHDPLKSYPQVVAFDREIDLIRQAKGLGEQTVDSSWYASGSLVLVNLRREDVYRRDVGNDVAQWLSPSLVVLLRDENGNNHYRRFSYLPFSVPGHRNRFEQVAVIPEKTNSQRQHLVAVHRSR